MPNVSLQHFIRAAEDIAQMETTTLSRSGKFVWRLSQGKMDALQLENRLAFLKGNAEHLEGLVQEKRERETHPQVMYALRGGHRPSPEDEARAGQARKQREDRISREYAPLESAISEHIQCLGLLKADIETMIKNEGRRSFWSGFWVNAFFFVFGLGVSAVSLSWAQVYDFLGVK